MSDNTVKIKKQTIDPTLTLEDVKKQLIEKGKKEGHLSHEEIAEKLQNFDIDSDQMDDFFDQLNDNDISLVNEKEGQKGVIYMHNMSDIIEQYIKRLFEESNEDVVEIQRANIAQRFDCVPSQLNYVIKTRFTNEHGYEIESKRGGGGYIRITKIENKDATGYINHLLQLIGPSISQQQAYYIIDGLLDKMLINEREAKMIQAVIDRETLSMDMVSRDIIRANILKRLLPVINYY